LSNGGFVKLPQDKVNDADADSTNELQNLSLTNDTLFLTNGGSVPVANLNTKKLIQFNVDGYVTSSNFVPNNNLTVNKM
jgi:hypothetical protein